MAYGYRSGYRKSFEKVEAPSALPKGAHIGLTQESAGQPAPPEGTMLNSPVYSRDCFLVECSRVKGAFFKSLGIDAQFQTAQQLEEDFDHFDAQTGWRVWGSAEELKKKFEAGGYPVAITTIADLQRHRDEAKARQAAKAETERVEREANKKRREQFDALVAEKTAGLFRVDQGGVAPGEGELVAEWKAGDSYASLYTATSKINGSAAFRFPHGGYDDYRVWYFVDADTRHAVYAERKAEFKHTREYGVEQFAKYGGCVGGDYYEWLSEQEN